MIQELFGGSNVGLVGCNTSKLSAIGATIDGLTSSSPTPSPSPSQPSSSVAAATTAATTTTSSSPTENLRCPRCDSSNTKFCYYNNYNLTQPRHFCKTCRRYWTKGGALRNVPIGGGCRKNKNTTITTSVGKSNAGRFKTVSSESEKTALLTSFQHAELSSNPVFWAAPHNSHLLSLLRANQNANPNPNPNPVTNSVFVKEGSVLNGSYFNYEPSLLSGVLTGRTRTVDPISQLVNSTMLSSSIRMNNQQETQANQGFTLSEVQNSGLQDLYQKFRSPINSYPEHARVIPRHVASASSSSSAILESAPVAAGSELGFWSSNLAWSNDLPTTSGAFP